MLVCTLCIVYQSTAQKNKKKHLYYYAAPNYLKNYRVKKDNLPALKIADFTAKEKIQTKKLNQKALKRAGNFRPNHKLPNRPINFGAVGSFSGDYSTSFSRRRKQMKKSRAAFIYGAKRHTNRIIRFSIKVANFTGNYPKPLYRPTLQLTAKQKHSYPKYNHLYASEFTGEYTGRIQQNFYQKITRFTGKYKPLYRKYNHLYASEFSGNILVRRNKYPHKKTAQFTVRYLFAHQPYKHTEAAKFSGNFRPLPSKYSAKEKINFAIKHTTPHRPYTTKIASKYTTKSKANSPVSVLLANFTGKMPKKISNSDLIKFRGKDKVSRNYLTGKRIRRLPKLKYDVRESQIWY